MTDTTTRDTTAHNTTASDTTITTTGADTKNGAAGSPAPGTPSAPIKNADLELKILDTLQERGPAPSTSFRITKGAHAKAMAYAKVIAKLAGGCMECYGYPLSPIDSPDDTITDVCLAADQDARSAYVRVTEEGVHHAAETFGPQGLRIVGWWHSHGTMSTFHSGTDVANFLTVLHSVAPSTMYRTEKTAHLYDKGKRTLITDKVSIKGIDIPEGTRLDVTRKVERDPFAVSMVVNVYGDRYLERITKTPIPGTSEYTVNSPIHPRFEPVARDEDVRFTMSQLEDDVTRSVRMQTRTEEAAAPERYDHKNAIMDFGVTASKSRSRFIESFVDAAIGKAKSPLITATQATERKGKTNDGKAKTGDGEDNAASGKRATGIDDDRVLEMIATLEERLATTKPRYATKNAYDIQGLRDQVMLQFMKEYGASPTDATIRKFSLVAQHTEAYFDLAARSGKILAHYAMKRITDYDGREEHKYTNFVAHMLERLNTREHRTLDTALVYARGKRGLQSDEEIFLYSDRLNVVNNIMTALVFNASERKYTDFLTSFADKYQEDPASKDLDAIIETKLMPLLKVKPEQCQDRDIIPRERPKPYEWKARSMPPPSDLDYTPASKPSRGIFEGFQAYLNRWTNRSDKQQHDGGRARYIGPGVIVMKNRGRGSEGTDD